MLLFLFSACGDDGEAVSAHSPILLSTEGEHLNAYKTTAAFTKQTLVSGGEDEHAGGLSLNGEVCVAPDGSRVTIVADDAGQPEVAPGWAVLRVAGNAVGKLSVARLGRLTPTYQADRDPYGCAFLADGRLLTTDIGNNASGDPTGQLILWFPPLDGAEVHYCKLDVAIGTAGSVYVDAQQRVYVASARVEPGIYRYAGALPTSPTASGGCGGSDATGAPLAQGVVRERFIRSDAHARTPSAIVSSGRQTFYVSSVLNGVIAEYDADGNFLRDVLRPPAGETLAAMPFSTGSPFGIAIDAGGTLYYADLALVIEGLLPGPGDGLGTVRRIRFVGGTPQPPETIDRGLNFPDGVGLLR